MNPAMIAATMLMIQQNQRRMEQDRLRRREQEERDRKRRLEEERKREEEYRKMVEYRKSAPVVCNDEQWQIDRCVKATSMQSCVRKFVSLVDELLPRVINSEENNYDNKLIHEGYEYEKVRRVVEKDIEALRESGITIDGSRYKFTRLKHTNANMAIIEEEMDTFGTMFTINGGKPIELYPKILANSKYFEDRYREFKPESLEQEYNETKAKLNRYQKFGKYFSFLLNTDNYCQLKGYFEGIEAEHEECEVRKKELQSFESLSEEQLALIKSYFNHLDDLREVSNNISDLFREKRYLRNDDNNRVYDLTINKIMTSEEYSELVAQVADYISKMASNETDVMRQAYELVKGEYPVTVPRRFVYDLIIAYFKGYKEKEEIKRLIRSFR